MSRTVAPGGGADFGPRPTKVVVGLVVSLVVAFVLQMVALRAVGPGFLDALALSPRDVYLRGHVWQLLTYGWLHAPSNVGHLLMNLLWLWLFGTQMESWWGPRRFLGAYLVFVASGGLLTVLVGLLCETGIFDALLPGFPASSHIGASGGALGITVAWGLTHAERELQFLFLGRMKGSTFVLLIIAIELLTALSFSNTSVTAHFGGILGAFVLCRGLWRPSRWRALLRRQGLKRQRSAIERQLRILEGSKKPKPEGWRVIDGGTRDDDPKKWN